MRERRLVFRCISPVLSFEFSSGRLPLRWSVHCHEHTHTPYALTLLHGFSTLSLS
ncbi:putative multicopper oxidase, copper-binding protein [Helianthus annuus]|nr:putative multicopper oxidase, copper-binding protein [Helianthus annuus]